MKRVRIPEPRAYDRAVLWHRAALVGCSLLACALSLGQQARVANLLPNPGFEQLDKGAPVDWTLTSDGGLVSFTLEEESPKEGQRSLRMEGQATFSVARSARVPINPTAGYTFTAHARIKAGNAIILLTFFEGDKSLSTEASQVLGPAEGWQQLTCSPKTGIHPTATHVVASVIGSSKMDVAFDDLKLATR